jgi:hypothetical protein
MNEEPTGKPARYRGKIVGQTMTLRVTLSDDDDSEVGTFTLTHGKAAQLTKCL